MKYTFIILVIVTLIGCKKDPTPVVTNTGKLTLTFNHYVGDKPLQIDSLIYVNASGNTYQVSELMYFISDIELRNTNGMSHKLNAWKDIFYIDHKMPETLIHQLFDTIPVNQYDQISFTFGLSAAKNKSFLFVNAPEVNMMWPDILGGGYHYMMLNGKWLDSTNTLRNLNFHLGIGQIYAGTTLNTDSITSFVHNDFKVTLPLNNMQIVKEQTKNIQIKMDIQKWFNTPTPFNLNYWGGEIMQKQAAMEAAATNGRTAFSVLSIN